MQVRALISAVALVLAVAGSTALADEKLDAVEKEIVQKWKDIKSMTAKMNMNAESEQGGAQRKTTMACTIEYLRQGDKMLSRLDGEMKNSYKMGDNEQSMTIPTMTISDGEIEHTLMEREGQKMCVKTKAQANSVTGEAMFKFLREHYDLSLASDEEIDGDKCWVVEAKPKATARPGEPAKTCYYFRQKDGATVRIVAYDADGKPAMTTNFTDIKLNVDLDPKRFEFKLPEGVREMDMTNRP